MILEMFPETGDVEIICPVKEAKFLAEITKPESTILSIVASILAHLLSTISMVPRALSHLRPNQSIRWQGSHIDFSSFVMKPASPRSALTALDTLLHTWRSLSMAQPSSRKIAMHMPWGRRGGLMVSALDSGVSGPGSSPGRWHCVVFLGKTLYSQSASLHPGV